MLSQGHKFVWSPNIRFMVCYEIDYMPEYGTNPYGKFRWPIVEAMFLHMDTLTTEIPADPLTALYANRMQYQIEVALKTFGDDVGFKNAGHILGTAGTYVDPSINIETGG